MFGFLKRRSAERRDHENMVFKEKYLHFRELLDRNHEVLETISKLADVKEHEEWISVAGIRSKITHIAVTVYKLIENLNHITDGRYSVLTEIFSQLEEKIEEILNARINLRLTAYTMPLDKVNRQLSQEVGAKSARLGEIRRTMRWPVPDGEAITAFCCQEFFQHNRLQERINKEELTLELANYHRIDQVSQRIQALVMEAELPPRIDEAIQSAYRHLKEKSGSDVAVVLRSSAVGEDDLDSSFAGLYKTVTNPRPENLARAYKQVVASKYSARAITYQQKKGMHGELLPMCALLMELVEPVASGVMYTLNPNTREDELLINAVWGLGGLAVGGRVIPDQYRVRGGDSCDIIEKRVGSKHWKLTLAIPEGTQIVEVATHLQEKPCLSDDQICNLVNMGLQLETLFQYPQDVEWAINPSGTIYIVQARPLKIGTMGVSWGVIYPREDLAETYPLLASDLLVASPGAACGKVMLFKSDSDMEKVQSGTVLVVPNAAPDLVSVLPEASAVVSERGSTTSHLAIIAREFHVPMVIGLQRAREVLKAGTEVTVDAYKGAIFRGKVESLLEMASALRDTSDVPLRSPTQRILDDVLQYVTPLNLINPEAASFKPESIRTIHDIIRFSHEKAINGMFNINDARFMKKGTIKRLISNVPLDMYIIDIGGGLSESCKGNNVVPEEITSIPMQAIYRGMTTEGVRWAGHIPIDFKSFISVFANTMFDASKHERRLGDRSYAIASRNYVNFSSRLGYHFSIVDAYVGPAEEDNYVSFRFKGGAASIEKRTRRVRFISEVLQRHGFWVDQRADLVNARVKGLSEKDTEEKLVMIGCLMGSARQLDVTMHGDAMVKRYVELFMQGDYSMGYGESKTGVGA